jgi:molybdate transport system permease protein
MLAGNIPGRTTTMPLEIYNQVVGGSWAAATGLVAFFTVVSGGFIYLANRLGRMVVS